MTSRLAAGVLLILLLLSTVVSAADHATVFIYHRFGDSRYPSTNTSLTDFRAHLDTLRAGGYAVLPLSEIVDRLRNGSPFPERCVAITVDDAFRSFLRGAVPLLREYGYPATLFVNTGEMDGPDYMTWEELRGLTKDRIEVGSHSATHGYLLDRKTGETRAAWRARVKVEIRRSQEELTTRLGRAPRLFAYPYGEFSRELIEVVSELGFVAAVGQQSGVVGRGQDLFALPRFPAGGSYGSPGEFRDRLRFRALPLKVLAPADTLVDSPNPPVWRVRLDTAVIDPRTLRCYVPGQPPARVTVVEPVAGIYEIRAVSPLTDRRSKYTLTATDRQGNWGWYSQLWVRPKR
ncbi:MAG: polysaccharide deacetylase family protein [Desulfuromonadales bacterium]|nr:polysaccharide deacetylase family protein [Desulfuromonadales bacterium]